MAGTHWTAGAAAVVSGRPALPVWSVSCLHPCHSVNRQWTIYGREVTVPEHNETQTDITAHDLVAETLVEEVFIDGMCGVY